MTMYVTKMDGSREPFDKEKLTRSLVRAGATASVAQRIVQHLERELVQEISSPLIYEHARKLLAEWSKPAAARYSLKRALIALGPSGFPFERYVSEILKAQGFEAITNQFITGRCVTHEVDIVAWKGEKLILIEAKFHNTLGIRSDLKDALYIKARFDDLKEAVVSPPGRTPSEVWFVTNTKFTERAITYSVCAGVKLLGWSYPPERNLHDFIEAARLHPLTCLESLTAAEKEQLLEGGFTLARELLSNEAPFKLLNFSPDRRAAVVDELNRVCKVP